MPVRADLAAGRREYLREGAKNRDVAYPLAKDQDWIDMILISLLDSSELWLTGWLTRRKWAGIDIG